MSLTEALTAIFILVLLIGVVYFVYLGYVHSYQIQVAYGELSSDATFAQSKASEYIRGATRVMASATINSTAYTTDHGTLVLELPAIDASHSIIPSTFDTVAIMRDPANPSRLLFDVEPAASSSRTAGQTYSASTVSSLTFNLAPIPSQSSSVETIIIFSKEVRLKPYTHTVQTTTHLRN